MKIHGISVALGLSLAIVGAPMGCSPAEDKSDEADTDTDADTDSDTDTDADTDTDMTPTSTLDAVIARDSLNCGVSGSAIGFSEDVGNGDMVGFDADFCRAVAAGVLGDETKVTFVALDAAERFDALKNQTVDVLIRNTTWTQARDALSGSDFGPTNFYDGQQLMGRESDGFTSSSTVSAIDGTTICTFSGTTTELNLVDLSDDLGLTITLNQVSTFDDLIADFIGGDCDLVSTDGSGLAGIKATLQPEDQTWVIFPPAPISKEPLGPVYLEGDSKWAGVVNWTVYAMILFDEKGITSTNAAAMKSEPPDSESERLLGGSGELQTAMGLRADAFYDVVRLVGNYDEVFTDNLVPLGLSRAGSPNASYEDGGLIYAPPAR